ncbi:hypothetical protein [Novosphingobium sp.]|uniref:hypothetical protein n=1 Tax=Novosphingobium sp. TaxID=1874826 RepID=UPI0025EDFAA2|nr:hypothetical protein [Novosphingobium sp.]
MHYNQLNGWLLRAVADLDMLAPGVAGHVIRASDERRHIIASLLSVSPIQAFGADLGQFVQSAGHDVLIEAAFGLVPFGYRRALARCGQHTQPRRFYPYLARLLSSPDRTEMARAVRLLPRVTWPRLQIIRILPEDLQHPSLVDIIDNAGQARDLTAVVKLLSEHGACRSEMAEALAATRTPEAISRFARRWSMKITFPPHPIPASDRYRPISTGVQLQDSARRFRNCARSHLVRILEQRSSFAEVRHDHGSAVVHLVKDGAFWVLDDVYGPANERPPLPVEKFAQEYLERFGITRMRPATIESPFASLRRLTGRLDFEF